MRFRRSFSNGNFLNTEGFRKIGKRDAHILQAPEKILPTPKKFNHSDACHARASALAVTARMRLVAA